jgi:hypothetical protein
MKIKLLVVFLVLTALLAGCGKGKSINTVTEDPGAKKEVTSAAEFQNIYRGWTDRLTKVADSTDQAYNSWSSGQISRDDLAAETRALYKETKRLKTESSYNTVFNLSENDKKLVDYDLVTNSYSKALIQMNDFLDLLPTLDDEQIKTSYTYTKKVVRDQRGIVKNHL